MFALRTDEQSALFAEEKEDVHDCEHSSDGGSASNSDAEPEEQDSESDEDDPSASTHPGNQMVAGRHWNYIASDSSSVEYLQRECSLTERSEHVATVDECFHLFINEEIIHTVILYTNMKANKCMSPNKNWKPVDRTEMDAFFALLLLIGRFRESRERKQDLWKTTDALSRQFYTATMSRDRFIDILRYIRFDDSATREERKATDKLAPLRDVTNIFTKNCKESYNATDVGCVDEQLVTFRGRCSFKVYMPNKPGKYGIKIWTLCDSQTYYCCNMDVYLGKQGNAPEKQQGQRVVKQLTDFWRNSGRCVTTDNFFTDISLAEYLLDINLYLVGTMRKNRRDLPKMLIDIQNRCLYSSQFLFTPNITLVSYVPKLRKCVVLLSTLHREHKISAAAQKFKPEIINYYNSTKSGVDVLDKLVREYSCRRCTRRWPLSLFMHYLDIAAYNAFVVWHVKNPTWEVRHSSTMRRKLFLEALAKKLTAKNIDRRATQFENQEGGLSANIVRAIEATGRKIVKKTRVGGLKRARCCYCVGNDNKYPSKCESCSKHVCKNHSTETHRILCNTCNDDIINME